MIKGWNNPPMRKCCKIGAFYFREKHVRGGMMEVYKKAMHGVETVETKKLCCPHNTRIPEYPMKLNAGWFRREKRNDFVTQCIVKLWNHLFLLPVSGLFYWGLIHAAESILLIQHVQHSSLSEVYLMLWKFYIVILILWIYTPFPLAILSKYHCLVFLQSAFWRPHCGLYFLLCGFSFYCLLWGLPGSSLVKPQ